MSRWIGFGCAAFFAIWLVVLLNRSSDLPRGREQIGPLFETFNRPNDRVLIARSLIEASTLKGMPLHNVELLLGDFEPVVESQVYRFRLTSDGLDCWYLYLDVSNNVVVNAYLRLH